MRAVCRRLEGAFTLVALAPRRARTSSSRPGATRPLVRRRRRRRVLPRPATSPPSSRTPAAPSSSARTRSSSITPRRATRSPTSPAAGRPHGRTTSTGTSRPPRRAATSTSCSRRSQEQPDAVADTLRGRLIDGPDRARRDCGCPTHDLRDVDKVFVVACGTAYHSGLIAKYAIEHWTRIPVEVELASEFRYRDPVLDRQTLVVAISQSGETADTLMAVRHAREQQARVLADLQHATARRSRASPTPCSTPTPGPRSASPRPRPSWRSSPPDYLVGLALAQARGTKYGDEIAPRVRRRSPRCRPRSARRWTRWSRSAPSPARSPTPRRCCSSAGTSATRWRWRARSSSRSSPTCTPRASPAGELKHGPIALIEQGLPVVVDHAVADRSPAAARQDAVQHRRDPRPRRPHRS